MQDDIIEIKIAELQEKLDVINDIREGAAKLKNCELEVAAVNAAAKIQANVVRLKRLLEVPCCKRNHIIVEELV